MLTAELIYSSVFQRHRHPRTLSDFELGISSLSSCPTTSSTTSPPARPDVHPVWSKNRSRMLEKEGVNFRAKRRRVDLAPPQMMMDRAPGSGESSEGCYSPSLPSTRNCSRSLPSTRISSPSLPPSRSSPVCCGSPPTGAAIQRSPASPTSSTRRTTRLGRFHPYSKPESPALPPQIARSPPPPARSPPITRSQTGSLPLRTSPS
ncbi:hypothetical protein CEXT_512131, partial [Caerostris extrusa]